MTQLTIKWPNGTELAFDGEMSFEQMRELLDSELPPLLANVPGARRTPVAASSDDKEEGEQEESAPSRIDFAYLDARLEEVGARTDVERITVFAQVAVDAGAPGLDIPTAENWYRQLALRMPGVWRSTFGNAQARGYLQNVGRGLWSPTSAGMNFALRGDRRPSPARRTRRTRQGAGAS